ncbi:MAG: hypothetical protein H6561_11550 [Lewinellaceae bacterium]|nr:hypothetical protein [Lewinellaceae bacterium]
MRWELINSAGNSVLKGSTIQQSLNIPLDAFPAGLYLLRVRGGSIVASIQNCYIFRIKLCSLKNQDIIMKRRLFPLFGLVCSHCWA